MTKLAIPEDPDEDGIYSDEDYEDDTLDVEDDGSIDPKKSLIDPMTGVNKPEPTNVKEIFSFTYNIATSLLDELAIVDDIGVNESEITQEFNDLICIKNINEHELLKEGITMSMFTEDPIYIKRAFKVLESGTLKEEEEANQGFEKLKDEWEEIKKGGGEAKDVADEEQDKKYFVSKKDIAEAFKRSITDEYKEIFYEEMTDAAKWASNAMKQGVDANTLPKYHAQDLTKKAAFLKNLKKGATTHKKKLAGAGAGLAVVGGGVAAYKRRKARKEKAD